MRRHIQDTALEHTAPNYGLNQCATKSLNQKEYTTFFLNFNYYMYHAYISSV